MQYHVQTAPVWDAYSKDGCPLCRIQTEREKSFIEQYLSDNVMIPEFRVESNRKGFCAEHIRMLYDGQNKLGLALQLETRATFLNELSGSAPTDKKSAKKKAAALLSHCGCVVCDRINEVMPRYYMTVAQMYDCEQDFKPIFRNASHCVAHTAELLGYAEYARSAVREYLSALYDGLHRELNSASKKLRDFADCFDHNSTAKPDPQTIPRAIRLLITPKLN